jgi:hypothetical protein
MADIQNEQLIKLFKQIKHASLFDESVSFFEGFGYKPKQISLSRWLYGCATLNKFANLVISYRKTLYPTIKKGLPFVTVGGLFNGGRRREHLIAKTGWIALDIDAKDNKHLPYANELKLELSKIENLAAIGLSASGNGVWALIKVKYPERQKEHFSMIVNDFELFGIKLDRSKGGNANDARFYSYDPDIIINPDFVIYDKLPQVKPLNNHRAGAEFIHSSNYVNAVVAKEIEAISLAREGERNNTLFKSSKRVFDFIQEGELDKDWSRELITGAALKTGMPEREIHRTIQSAFGER